MIPFTPKRTNELTYFFFAKRNTDDFVHVLRENMVTGWGMYPLLEVKHRLPDGLIIPEVKASKTSIRATGLKGITVFVSYYDADDLEKFFWEVMDHPDTHARHVARAKEANHNIEWKEKFKNDPAPWGLAELTHFAD